MEINIMDYIVSESYILIPVLYVVGLFLKKTPKIPDWLIPWILLGVSMLGGFFLAGMSIRGLLQGILVAGVTVFANQLYVQTVIKSKEADKSSGTASKNNKS